MIDFRDPALTARQVREALDLAPHPEGGFFREMFRDQALEGRGAATSIFFLLEAGECSHWHRIDATEIWIFQAGAPFRLSIADHDAAPPRHMILGPDLAAGETFQGVVAPGQWQAAETLGAWTLVSCIVAPAFSFEKFELAAPGWAPG